MEQHINYITLGVADLATSRRFYRGVFGWWETVSQASRWRTMSAAKPK